MTQKTGRDWKIRRSWPAPLRWAVRYLEEFFTDEPCAFHVELMRDLADERKRLIARVAPRGHAKSTLAALAYPLWCICQRKRRNIVIITHESSLATQFVRDIREQLETNERILKRYGDLCSDRRRRKKSDDVPQPRRKWTEAMFTTRTGITVQARGSGASFRGMRVGPHRPDLIICDDIEKDEHVASPEQRRKLEHWLRRVVMPALAPEGKLLVVGSLLHYDSLLANLARRARFPRWDYRVYRALEAERGDDGQYYLRALWPQRWSVQRLKEERERIGTIAFEQEYQANPIDEGQRVFRPEWLKRYDEDELVEENLVHIVAVDPATGASSGDFFALLVGAIDRLTGVIYVRELSLERIGIVQQVRRIVEAFERWRPVRVGIETVAYQAALRDALDEVSRSQRLYIPIVALRPVASKRSRIEGLAPLLERGVLRFPRALDARVEQQFVQFPKARHDDAPDVCALGVELARSLRRSGPVEATTAGRRFERLRGGW